MMKKNSTARVFLILGSVFLLVLGLSCGRNAKQTAVSADGVSIRFTEASTGDPALIFISGWGGTKEDWDYQMDHFSGSHRCVAIDLAGFGESGSNRTEWTMPAFAGDVTAVMDQLGIDEAVIIGHSMGGMVALEAARANPDRIIGVVPVDVIKDVELSWQEAMHERTVNYFMDLAMNPTFEKIRQSAMFSAKADSAMILRALNVFESSEKKGWEASLREVLRYMSSDLRDCLEAVSVPVCCINAESNTPNLETARKYHPGITAKTISDVGHIVFWEEPDEFNRLLEETIEEFVGNDH